MLIRLFAALSLLCAFTPASAETLRFYGYAFDLKTDKYLYTEIQEQDIDANGKWISGRVRYVLPDGSALGNKTLDFAADPHVPVYRMELPLSGYSEGITRSTDPIVMQRQEKGKQLETESIKRDGPTCADAGFHSFLLDHFDRLMKGEKVNLKLVVAGGLDQFKFRARRIEDGTFEGKPAVRFYVEPDSLLRFVVDPLELTYDGKTRQLLEYRGMSNVIDPATGKLFVTRISYFSKTPDGVSNLPPLTP
ncbi:MAG TPA: hypothetical protein VGE51_13770 [Fontimonas sp.]